MLCYVASARSDSTSYRSNSTSRRSDSTSCCSNPTSCCSNPISCCANAISCRSDAVSTCSNAISRCFAAIPSRLFRRRDVRSPLQPVSVWFSCVSRLLRRVLSAADVFRCGAGWKVCQPVMRS